MFPARVPIISQPPVTSTAYANTYSLDFDGTDDYVDCGDISELNSVTALTISGWFNQTTINLQKSMFGMGASVNESTNVYTWNDGNMYLDIRSNTASTNGYGYFDYSTVVTATEWFHFALVYDGAGTGNAGKCKCYIDGAAISLSFGGTIPTVLTATASDFFVGETGGLGTHSWLGLIDEVAIFDQVLDSSRISTIYNSGVPTDLSGENGLVAYWRMEEGTGTSVTNTANPGTYDASLENGTAWDTDLPS